MSTRYRRRDWPRPGQVQESLSRGPVRFSATRGKSLASWLMQKLQCSPPAAVHLLSFFHAVQLQFAKQHRSLLHVFTVSPAAELVSNLIKIVYRSATIACREQVQARPRVRRPPPAATCHTEEAENAVRRGRHMHRK